MSKHINANNVYIQSEYLRVLANVLESELGAKQKGLIDTLVNDAGIDTQVDFKHLKKILDVVFELDSPNRLAMLYGASLLPSKHGFLGYAIKSSANLEEALNITVKYVSTRITIFQVDLLIEGDDAVIVFTENVTRSRYTDFVLIAMLISFYRVGMEMFPDANSSSFDSAAMVFNSLKMKAENPNIRGLNIKFSQARNETRFDRSFLGQKLSTRDDDLYHLALTQVKGCEDVDASLVGVVKTFVRRDYGFSSTLEDLAEEMCVSPRTLKRRLSDANISYREILKQVRKERAIHLLSEGEMNIDEIAEAVGYADTSNFCKAFRRWTGVSAKKYQESLSCI